MVLEGSEVTLECLGDHKLTLHSVDTTLEWLKDEKTVEDNDKIRNKWVKRGEWTGFSLIIKNVSKEDAGHYRCEGGIQLGSDYRILRASRELEIFERGKFDLYLAM